MNQQNKTKTNSEIQKPEWWLPEGKGVGEGELGKESK